MEAQLSQSRAGQEVAKANDTLVKIENDLVAMEEQYNDLLAEGDTKGAAQLMTQIRRKNAELSAVTAEQRDAEVMARAVEKVRYDEALDRIEEAYPELDPESDEYDEGLYQDVADLMHAGQRRGLPATKALQRAVQRVMGADTGAQKRATTVTPISEQAVMQAHFIRSSLEQSCMRVAALKLTPAELDALDALVDRQEKMVTAGRRDAFHALDDQFHRDICAAAGLDFVWALVRDNKGHMDRVRYLSLTYGASTAWQEHRQIMAALRARDPDAAAAAMRQHLGRIESILARLRQDRPEVLGG